MAENNAPQSQAPSPVPIPPNFPVTWEGPDDERLFWHLDIMHFPEPMTPISARVVRAISDGFREGAEVYSIPVTLANRRINTYIYEAVTPLVPPEEMEARGRHAEEKIGAAMGRIQENWDSELLPEVKEHLTFWESFDLKSASMPQLVDHVQETWKRLDRLWVIHFLWAFPAIVAGSQFDELYQDLFGGEGAFGAFKLLQGFGNKTVEGGHALWALSRKALASPGVRKVLEETDAADVPAALKEPAEGQAFLAEFTAFLEEYGQRSDIFAEVGNPHWIENPTTPITNLKDYIQQPDRDIIAELESLAAGRESLLAEIRERLGGYPQPVVQQFEFLLAAAKAGTITTEDHNFWIDQRGTYKVRRVVLEFGRRFAEAGMIDAPNDVFFLVPEELPIAAAEFPQGDLRSRVAERKAEMEHFRAIQPPILGTPPSGPPPDDPIGKAIGKFFGAPPQESEDPDVLNGNPCSPGKVTGTAKVVMSLSQASKLQPGDIMIAPSTMPAWTPLFASIAAVVTDAGGILSHAGIVAREYNIPAVLGTGKGTAVIKDGQTVEVDGDAGVVRIVSS